MSGPDVRAMQDRLLAMQEAFQGHPTDEQRRDYIALWLEWCDAKGLPRTARRDAYALAATPPAA